MSKPNEQNRPKDDPRSAPEEGDPLESGRSRGQVVGNGDTNRDVKDESGGTGEQFASGRQDAAPRAQR